jgi:hypothetical protein
MKLSPTNIDQTDMALRRGYRFVLVIIGFNCASPPSCHLWVVYSSPHSVIQLQCFICRVLVPELVARRRQLQYWPPFSLADIGSHLQRWEILSVKMAANTEAFYPASSGNQNGMNSFGHTHSDYECFRTAVNNSPTVPCVLCLFSRHFRIR